MTGAELRARIDNLGLSYTEAAKKLGLSLPGLQHNLRDERPIGRQTELLLECVEKHQPRRVAVRVRERKLSLLDPAAPKQDAVGEVRARRKRF
jgi:hypothetical protein